MSDENAISKRAVTRSILSDVHFWVPFVVLVVGLTVLVICARA